jgi:coenzyme F420-dependent glucose-6-phosphate dehydrogenase
MSNFKPLIGYHASHEQFSPSELLHYAMMAERSGFDVINCSDHFHPWSERQGQSGYSFAWLGAAMQATEVPFGVVCAPGQRNNVAVVAQAAATLSEMFPGRFWMSLGSGEALNENITGERWMTKAERNQRLLECVEIIRKLFRGKCVSHKGLITVQEAKLYTLPKQLPLLIGAALSIETASWMGGWADGLITVNKPIDELKKVIDAFRNGGGEGKPLYVKVQLSYDHSGERALEGAWDQWRANVLPHDILGDLSHVKQFDAAAQFVRMDDVEKHVHISASPKQFVDWICGYAELGFERIILHNVNRNQESFIREFGENVLPMVRKSFNDS